MIVLLAAKSIVIAGGTLLMLRFMRGRSASDRSWIAHLGLAALVALPLGSLLIPPLEVSNPYASVLAQPATASSGAAWIVPGSPALRTPIAEAGWAQRTATDWLLLGYAVVALCLIARTLLALLRLMLLTRRACAVTDDYWLQALTRARRRINFTRSTALLASSEIASALSWGALRPKILVNTDAIAARADADAILAHELAHVARADWATLVLARASVAFFWFNPFAWLLAREAHQLREEAADDAVLAADVEDMAYASLLVSAARLQRDRLLLGAHGVAPARNSLSRRVQRVLNRGLNRSAGGTGWAAAMAVGAAALTAPVMTLQFTDAALASSASDTFRTASRAQDLVTFDLRVPERGPSAAAALAEEAEVQSKASAEQGQIEIGSATTDRPLEDGRD
jgi:beta-lactamase regulating signal transducer with metallopeptidase domain